MSPKADIYRSVKCPFCGAKPGDNCKSFSASLPSVFHNARKRKARALLEKEEKA